MASAGVAFFLSVGRIAVLLVVLVDRSSPNLPVLDGQEGQG